MNIEVVVVGSAMLDLTTYTEKMPAIGETVKGLSFERNFGGKGANQAVQCQRLGVSTAFIGKVGSDSYGKDYIDHFRSEGIFTDYFQVAEGSSTGIAAIWVDQLGNNSIIIVPGANLHVESSRVSDYVATFPNAKVAVFQNEIADEATKQGLLAARKFQILSILNPAPVSESCKSLIGLSDILCVNEVELAVLAERTVDSEISIIDACRHLSSFGCKEIVVTFGSKGAFLFSGEELFSYPAPTVKAVDTVGAGDSFIGCMAANLARGISLKESITRAVQCASVSVQLNGAQPSYAGFDVIPECSPPPRKE